MNTTEVITHGMEQTPLEPMESVTQPADSVHIVRALLLSPSEGAVLVCVGEDGAYHLPGGHYDMPAGKVSEEQAAHIIKDACRAVLETNAGVIASDRSDPLPNGKYTVVRGERIVEYEEDVLTAIVVGTHAHGANLVWLPISEADYMIRRGETLDNDGKVHTPDKNGSKQAKKGLVFHKSALDALSVLAGTIHERYRPETADALAKISQAIKRQQSE